MQMENKILANNVTVFLGMGWGSSKARSNSTASNFDCSDPTGRLVATATRTKHPGRQLSSNPVRGFNGGRIWGSACQGGKLLKQINLNLKPLVAPLSSFCVLGHFVAKDTRLQVGCGGGRSERHI